MGIIDLVGDTARVFHTGDIGVRLYDSQSDMVNYVYEFEHGLRLQIGALPLQGLSRQIIQKRQSVVVNSELTKFMAEIGANTIPGTDTAKSMVGVPIISGDEPRGLIILENHERENAYSEADIRLLNTDRQPGRGAGECPPVRRDAAC
jgi:GAF domain-containing protein